MNACVSVYIYIYIVKLIGRKAFGIRWRDKHKEFVCLDIFHTHRNKRKGKEI